MNNFEQQRIEKSGVPVPPPSAFDDFDFDAVREAALKDRPFGGPKPVDSYDFSGERIAEREDAVARRAQEQQAAAKLLNEIRNMNQ